LKVLLYNNIFQQYYGRCLLLSNSVKDMNFDRNVVFQFLPYNFKCIPSSMCYLHYSTEAYLLREPLLQQNFNTVYEIEIVILNFYGMGVGGR